MTTRPPEERRRAEVTVLEEALAVLPATAERLGTGDEVAQHVR